MCAYFINLLSWFFLFYFYFYLFCQAFIYVMYHSHAPFQWASQLVSSLNSFNLEMFNLFKRRRWDIVVIEYRRHRFALLLWAKISVCERLFVLHVRLNCWVEFWSLLDFNSRCIYIGCGLGTVINKCFRGPPVIMNSSCELYFPYIWSPVHLYPSLLLLILKHRGKLFVLGVSGF